MTEPATVTGTVEVGDDAVDGGERIGRWMRVLGGIGWAFTFLTIYTTTHLVVRIGFDAVGISTTAIPQPSGDPKNPPGQFVAILGSVAVGVLATVALRGWCHRGKSERDAPVEVVG